MEVTGKIKLIGEIKTYDSGFQKRELILLTQEQYPQTLSIEFLQDNVNLLNTFNQGNEVKVSINLRGREWVNPQGETKYFNSIVAWRIELIGNAVTQPEPTENTDGYFNDDEGKDDLPF